MSKPTITFDQFQALDLRIGTIKTATRLENSSKLIVLTVDFASANSERSDDFKAEERTILAGIGKVVTDLDSLVGAQLPFILNLEPKELAGVVSNGMMLAIGGVDGPVLLQPILPVEPGSEIK